jgi:hypothetical protein
MSAATELQKAIFAALRGEAALVAALGGPKIFDHAPANIAFPYFTFGRSTVYDWSTATEQGSEHLVTLHVWSKAKGKAETLTLMDLAGARLHDAELALAGHRLVNLRLEFSDARFEEDVSAYHGLLRFRAVTETSL